MFISHSNLSRYNNNALDMPVIKYLKCSFLVGLDAAGKTTVLYKLKLGEIVTTIPTIGED